MNKLNPTESKKNLSPKLSPVEIQLLRYIAEGLSNREIARLKGVKIKSCENAISRVAKKLDIGHSPATNQRVLLAKEFDALQIEYFDYSSR